MVLLRHIEILKDHTPKRLKSSHFYKNKNKKPVIIFQLCIYFSFFFLAYKLIKNIHDQEI